MPSSNFINGEKLLLEIDLTAAVFPLTLCCPGLPPSEQLQINLQKQQTGQVSAYSSHETFKPKRI